MAKQVQLRRGDAAANTVFVGAPGELVMDTTNKDLRVHDGATVGGFRVPTLVDVQYPNVDNGYTWYRKWSDGWVEQGGYDNSTSSPVSVTLPVQMANTNYTAVCAYNATDADLSNGALTIHSRTTTGFLIKKWSSDQTCWEVRGMAA